MSALELLSRTTVVFVALLLLSKILGKKLISQMTFFDFVAGVAIGTLGGSAIYTKSIALGWGLAVMSLFCALTLFCGLWSLKSIKFRKAANGGPTLLIQNGKILEGSMAKTRLTMDNLLMLLRKKMLSMWMK